MELDHVDRELDLNYHFANHDHNGFGEHYQVIDNKLEHPVIVSFVDYPSDIVL